MKGYCPHCHEWIPESKAEWAAFRLREIKRVGIAIAISALFALVIYLFNHL